MIDEMAGMDEETELGMKVKGGQLDEKAGVLLYEKRRWLVVSFLRKFRQPAGETKDHQGEETIFGGIRDGGACL